MFCQANTKVTQRFHNENINNVRKDKDGQTRNLYVIIKDLSIFIGLTLQSIIGDELRAFDAVGQMCMHDMTTCRVINYSWQKKFNFHSI